MNTENKTIDVLNDELLERIKYPESDTEFKNGFVDWEDIVMVLDRFRNPIGHDSDCGVHNEPESTNKQCNCKLQKVKNIQDESEQNKTPESDLLKTKQNAFLESAKPLMKYLCENYHPHVTVIIDGTRAELSEGVMSIKCDDYIVD